VVLIHPGSGPTDRDGNSLLLPGDNDALKMLAEGLSEAGIASLRIDKRGVGESMAAMASEADLRFGHYVDDAALWIDHLRADDRFDRVYALGHSEGALITLLAAQRVGVDGYLSLAGTGESGADILIRQLSMQLPEPLLSDSVGLIEQLRAGEVDAEIPESVAAVPGLTALFRPSVLPYLASWFEHDPAAILAELREPTLIVQGTTDLQVGVGDAEALAAAQPDAELVIIEGMNHVLKDAPLDPVANQAAYADPSLPLSQGLLDAVAGFILETP
jgi:pimeloyl-ACP methyl ester carboxylesterase